MNDTDLLAALARESHDFDRAIGVIAERDFESPSDRAGFVVASIRVLAASNLPGREVDRRCRLVIESVHQDEGLLKLIVTGVQGLSPSVLNAVRGALPSHLRPLAMERPSQDGSNLPVVPTVAVPQVKGRLPDGPTSLESEVESVPTVVLIGTAVEHAANQAMLNGSHLQALRVPTLERLWAIDKSGVCGFVVAPSAWTGLDTEGQLAAVKRLCAWSTFTFTRLSLDGLSNAVASAVPSLLEAGLGRPSSERFCHGSSANLTPADLALIHASSALLIAAQTTRFVPLDLSSEEALLLRLIAGQRRSPNGEMEVRQIGAAQLHGGKSRARIFMLKVEQGRPFVVKFDDPATLRDELQRHRAWIAAWEPNVTEPVIHHHEERSAISYRLQGHADGGDRPAPTLEGEIEYLRKLDWWDPEVNGTDPAKQLGEGLEKAVARAAERLAELNRHEAAGEGLEFWLDWPAKYLAKRSVTHQLIGHDERPYELASIVSKAMEYVAPLHNKGVVHGDIHGRNILLVDRLPAFIDYATSGPGNPLVDLVRLDATVRHLAMRATDGEKQLTSLFCDLYVVGASAEKLLESHPALAASPSCKLALTTAAKTRACALELAECFHGGVREYLATVAVISAHVLVVRTPGSAVERAVLAAVAPSLFENATAQRRREA